MITRFPKNTAIFPATISKHKKTPDRKSGVLFLLLDDLLGKEDDVIKAETHSDGYHQIENHGESEGQNQNQDVHHVLFADDIHKSVPR